MLILVAAAASFSPAASAFAGPTPIKAAASKANQQRFGVRLYDVPVDDMHNPRGLRYIIDFLPSGSVIHRRILVLNQENQTARFSVYPDTARISAGQFTGDAGETRSELTTWITVAHPSLTIRPHASALDMVTITVPSGATEGEHYGVIWAQQVAQSHGTSGININEVARVGVRVYLAVGPGGVPPTKFTITSLTAHRTGKDQPVLVAHVVNTGQRAVDLAGQARLSNGPGHTSAGPFREQQILTLAPGQSADMTFAPPKTLPDGPWLATVTLVSGFNTTIARATIDFAGATPASLWTRLPMLLLGAALLITLAILGLVLIRHARQSSRVPAEPGTSS
jgi:hypothetical protein